ncbi:prepilin-type N-terminal cleavage/methylation domain-containing protein [Legionella hackeliae]|nr:prepilin-type N-terminal cleavage/methylation domain-containing protein [Legionella hackeliae]KTD10573.1 hypothetical protein Lhac_2941 [Legionella hackeliae]STX46802.1 Tfp pilus assembly protein PilV [Legionella hackeliae]
MKLSQGFSLIELLIALILLSSISLSLLNHQEHMSHSLLHIQQRSQALRLLDNNSERFLGRFPFTAVPQLFKLEQISIPQGILIQILWGGKLADTDCCKLQWKLFL